MSQENLGPVDPTVSTAKPIERLRADPAFKYQTRLIAEALGVKNLPTEFPQTLHGDLVLFVPFLASLVGTLFSFFRAYNVLEFKGQNDELNEYEFTKNDTRCNLLYMQQAEAGKRIKYADILNLFVCSREPVAFLKYMAEQGLPLLPVEGQPWLRAGKVGLKNVLIVVCRELPLESVYYPWLLFAPADSVKWREFVLQLALERNLELLELAQTLRPKEFMAMDVRFKFDFEEYLADASPEERKEYWKYYFANLKNDIPGWKKVAPEEFSEFLRAMPPEVQAEALKPETLALVEPETVAKLTPEQRQRLIKLLTEADDKPAN